MSLNSVLLDKKLINLGTLYNKIKKENTSASYYRSSRKELIYYMGKKQPPDSIELTV